MKRQEKSSIIWKRFRNYINISVFICCLIIAFNIHPTKTDDTNAEIHQMIYIFHDYEWNEYVLNDTVHGAANSSDYLFDTEVPESVKWNNNYTDSVSLGWNKNWKSENIKDNQVSLENIMDDLWIEWDSQNNNQLVIDLSKNPQKETQKDPEESSYSIKEDPESSTLTIEKESNDQKDYERTNYNDSDEDLLVAKAFTYTKEGRTIPTLVPWDELSLNSKDSNILAYNYNNSNWNKKYDNEWKDNRWITIIDDYKDCMTPWWYEIVHWDSVLAYKQIDNAPDICNIERRYCRNWKLSWTYTQQWCSINKNYSYKLWWEAEVPQKDNTIKWGARQNPDWSVTVKSDEIWWSIALEKPNRATTEYSYSDNIRYEDEWIEQTSRPHRDCTTPRWEKIKHGQYIQAFKHANWFSDSPCEAQFRLCSMWELIWTYKESTCKTRDTSFIDWINGSPTRRTYSKEKLDLIKKQIKNDEKYYKNTRKDAEKSTNSEALDRILYILDED